MPACSPLLAPLRAARRRAKLWTTVALAAALLTGAAAPCLAQDPSLTVGVLPLEIGEKIPASRESLEKMVHRGLALLAAPMVEAPESAARLKVAGATVPCDAPSCWIAAGRAIGTRYLVAGKVGLKDDFFEVEFKLIDGASGRILAVEPNRCEAADCSVAELCRLTVRELSRQTLGPSVPVAGAEPAPISAPSVRLPAGSGAETEDSTVGVERRLSPLRTAIAALGITGGVVGLVASGVAFSRHGDCSKRDATGCAEEYKTLWEGVGYGAAGVALLTTGIVVAWPRDRNEAPDLAMTGLQIWPGGISVSGRF